MPAFHLMALIEVIFLFTFYTQSGLGKKYYVSTLTIVIAFNIVNTLLIQRIDEFNSLAWSFNTLFLMGCGLLFLYKLYQSSENIPLEKNANFIINSGLLIYFSGSLFTYILGNDILSKEEQSFFHNAWVIQCISNISKNLIVAYGLWRVKFN